MQKDDFNPATFLFFQIIVLIFGYILTLNIKYFSQIDSAWIMNLLLLLFGLGALASAPKSAFPHSTLHLDFLVSEKPSGLFIKVSTFIPVGIFIGYLAGSVTSWLGEGYPFLSIPEIDIFPFNNSTSNAELLTIYSGLLIIALLTFSYDSLKACAISIGYGIAASMALVNYDSNQNLWATLLGHGTGFLLYGIVLLLVYLVFSMVFPFFQKAYKIIARVE